MGGVNVNKIIGVFCNRCVLGFTSWKCDCGTINPASVAKKEYSGGCFIATAAYGSKNHPEVFPLYTFRDEVLNSSIFGRWLINVYYAISPGIALIISKSRILKIMTRVIILKPTTFLINFINKYSFGDQLK